MKFLICNLQNLKFALRWWVVLKIALMNSSYNYYKCLSQSRFHTWGLRRTYLCAGS